MNKALAELTKINEMAAPHLANLMAREPWIVSLRSGPQVQVWFPLSAAMEIDAAGHKILAGILPR